MSDSSNIEWTDATWNPVAGCTRVNRDCDNCYAVAMTHRLEAMGQPKYAGLTVLNNKGDRHFRGTVRTDPKALEIPLRWRTPKRIFVNSMSDLFHKAVPFEFIDQVMATIVMTPEHTYQVLTKRPERAAEYFARPWADIPSPWPEIMLHRYYPTSGPPWKADCNPLPIPNLWLGTSCGHQEAADEMIPHLLRCPAAVRFLSVEPLTGPVDLSEWLRPSGSDSAGGRSGVNPKPDALPHRDSGISWVIVGGESGPNARPCNIQWIRSIIQQCQAAGVPVFVKQWGGFPVQNSHETELHGSSWRPDDSGEFIERWYRLRDKKGGDPTEWPADLNIREFPRP